MHFTTFISFREYVLVFYILIKVSLILNAKVKHTCKLVIKIFLMWFIHLFLNEFNPSVLHLFIHSTFPLSFLPFLHFFPYSSIHYRSFCQFFTDERSDISQEIADFIEINSAHLKEASIYITSPFKQGPQRHYQDARTVSRIIN